MSNSTNPLKIFTVMKDGARLPCYKTSGAAGADLCAFLEQPVTLQPMQRSLIPTGVFVEIPQGYELQLRPRSGIALESGITVLNSPGTIDSDYRGELLVLLINLSNVPYTVNNGQRIAQIVLAPVCHAEFELTDRLSETERGEKGYGSTGMK